MKKVLSLILALVMLLAMFTAVSAAAGPDTVTPTEASADEPAAAPAEGPADEPAAAPAEGPADEPAAAPAEEPADEPAAAPTEEPAEPEAAPAEVPAEPAPVSEPEAAAEPAPISEPVAEPEVVSEPGPAADDGIELTAAEPAATPNVQLTVTGETTIAVSEAVDCWKVWRGSPHGQSWRDMKGYAKLTAEVNDVPNTYLTWSVECEKGSEGNLFNTMIEDNNVFYVFGGYDMTNCKENCQYTVTVTAKYGEAKAEQKITFTYTAPTPTPTPAPTPVPARTVVLDANPGYFLAKELTDKSYVTFLPEGTGAYDTTTIKVALSDNDTLPSDLPNPVQTGASENADNELEDETHWTFDGWYTQKPTVTKVEAEGGWQYKATPNGDKVDKGTAVPTGVSTLYAYWKPDSTLEKTTIVTYKLDFNGFDGKTGALECERPYVEGGVKFTVDDSIIYGVNFDSAEVEKELDAAKEEEAKKEIIEKYWADHDFNGYKFTGWYTERTGGEELQYGIPVKNGATYYAHWTKDAGTEDEKDQSSYVPAPTPGPIDGMHIDARHLTIRQDPNKPESVTIPLFVTPVGGTGTITWTVKVPPTVDLENLPAAFKGETQTYTIVGDEITKAEDGITKEEPNFTAKAEGLNLTIFPQKGCSQVLFVSAACGDVTTPADATVVITHTPEEQETVTQAATCTAEGEAAILCAECGEATEVHSIPATGHTFKVVSTAGSVNGARLLNEQCEVCQEEETILSGDVNNDGKVNMTDVFAIYKFVAGKRDSLPQVAAGDVTNEGGVNMTDVFRVYKFVAGKIPTV